MRPAFAFQAPPAAQAPALDRALLDQFTNATDAERLVLIESRPDITTRPYLEWLSNNGDAARRRAELELAERMHSGVLFVGRTKHWPYWEAVALTNLGIVAGSHSDLARARVLFEEAAAIAEATNDVKSTLSSLVNLAILLRKTGDLDAALDTQQRALTMATRLNDKPTIARTLNNIGNVLQDQGNASRALEFYVESLSLKEEIGADNADVVNTLTNIGNIYNEQGDYPLTIEYYNRALALAEKNGGDFATATSAYNNLGRAYAALGNYTLAQNNLQRSLAMGEKTGDPARISMALYNMGVVARAEGRMDDAVEIQQRALTIREQGQDAVGLIESMTEMANLLNRRGRSAEGLPYAERSVALSSESRLLNQQWKGEMTAADIHAQLGHTNEARASYERAIELVEALRARTAGGERARQQYLSDRMGPYYGLAGIAAEAGRAFDALAVVDHARARTLIDILSGSRQPLQRLSAEQRLQEHTVTQAVLNASQQLDTEARKLRPDTQRLAELDKALDKARVVREAFLGELYAAQPSLKFAHGDTPEITRAGLASLLKPGTGIVTFVLDNNKAWTYVITRGEDGNPVVTTQALEDGTPAIVKLAETFAQQVSTRDLAFAPTARKLYDALLGKVDAQLRGVTELVVIPDGPLWQVPFQALQTPRGKFVTEERAVSYSPSIAALAALEQRQRARPKQPPFLVALGDPAISSLSQTGLGKTPWPKAAEPQRSAPSRLPEAAREVQALGKLYGDSRSSVLVAAAASESALRERSSKASVLHVATHGVLDNNNPMYSHLLLAPSAAKGGDHKTDGRLEAWEVMDLGINADLVVLSACATARGTNAFGEGVIGLSWSLFAAGASTAVVSQWEVDSASTTALMITFHQSRLQPKTPANVPQALRQAELALMKNPLYRHPFYWAGFIAVGAK